MHKTEFIIPAAILSSFLLTYSFIPSIIKIAEIKHLYDNPDERKLHGCSTPNLGGIAIFSGFLISFCLFSVIDSAYQIRPIIAALCLVFLIGAKDDIVPLVPYKKFIGQIFAAAIVVVIGKVRISSMYGLFGISMLNDYVSILLTIITIVFIINALNIIDGIDLLAGGVGFIAASTFAVWFYYYGFINYAVMGAALAGAILAFLGFNYSPAKIFMGDSGSLTIGLLLSLMAIEFIEKNEVVLRSGNSEGIAILSSPAMAIAVLIIPIFDTLRAFALRILKGKSPFYADRIHIHHRLVDLGLTHIHASFVLFAFNILFIVSVYFLQSLGNMTLLIGEFAIGSLFTFLLFSIKKKKKSNSTIHKKAQNLIETY